MKLAAIVIASIFRFQVNDLSGWFVFRESSR
jgi:hypothetical protein